VPKDLDGFWGISGVVAGVFVFALVIVDVHNDLEIVKTERFRRRAIEGDRVCAVDIEKVGGYDEVDVHSPLCHANTHRVIRA
jgi:hypothetical protein